MFLDFVKRSAIYSISEKPPNFFKKKKEIMRSCSLPAGRQAGHAVSF